MPGLRSECRAATASTVGVILCLASLVVAAQGTLTFESPPEGSEAPTNQYWPLDIEWRAGDHPVRNQPVTLTSSLGELESATLLTDEAGRATFSIRSMVQGTASILASGGTESAALTLHFDATFPSDTPGNPFGDRALARVDDQGRDIFVFSDRIGILVGERFTISAIDEFIARNGVLDVTRHGGNVVQLRLGRKSLTKELRDLARELQDPSDPGIDRSDILRSAGLVARFRDTDQWLLIPDQVIVRFVEPPSDTQREQLAADFGLRELQPLGRDGRRFLARLDSTDGEDPLELGSSIAALDAVEIAHPNYAHAIDLRDDPWTDPGVNLQWHHENDGSVATEDADIDSVLAGQYSYGSADALIAVIDRGFDIDHPDLKQNLWTNSAGERGIDLVDANPASLLSQPTSPEAYAHGTRAAGVAAARGGNTIGYSGACPQCKLLLIRVDLESDADLVVAFDEARAAGADVISNSWGYFGPSKILGDAIELAVDDGITVLMAMSNTDDDNCGTIPDTSSLPNVIAVSGVTDEDQRSSHDGEALGFGTCMDVLAPTRGGVKGIHTTSVAIDPDSGDTISTYWHDFSGTSASTPLAAGVAGLLTSLDDTLTPVQVQSILQDTADRIDPAHAQYATESGFSRGSGGDPTHGYGRINAFEAARLLAPSPAATTGYSPGRAGRDLVLRDHVLDWGNTEQPSNVILARTRYEVPLQPSPDIKVDVEPFGPDVTLPGDFASLQNEEVKPGSRSRAYVRLRNRGPKPVPSAALKLHAAIVAETYPSLPTDFWSRFPEDSADTSAWQPFPAKMITNIPYSGASVAGCPGRTIPECLPVGQSVLDAARITRIDLPALDWDPAAGERLALLAVVHSDEDSLQAKLGNAPPGDFHDIHTAVTRDNNVALWLQHGTEIIQPPPPQCPSWLLYLIAGLVVAAIVLLLYILWQRMNGNSVPPIITVLLAMVLAGLLLLYLARPECVRAALATVGM